MSETGKHMRRFVLFGGDIYYAAGGFHDYIMSFDTLDEAILFAQSTHESYPGSPTQCENFCLAHFSEWTKKEEE